MRPPRCAGFVCDHNCSGKCFYTVPVVNSPQHLVQLMVGAPLGPDMNSFVYWVRKILEAHYADDDGSALREPMDELQKLIDMLPPGWPSQENPYQSESSMTFYKFMLRSLLKAKLEDYLGRRPLWLDPHSPTSKVTRNDCLLNGFQPA